MANNKATAYKTFDDITERLDEIVTQVRDKETSLERSLDLFDEAIALGSRAVDMVDTTDFTPEEEARLQQAEAEAADAVGDGPAGEAGEAARDDSESHDGEERDVDEKYS
jgi:cytosine/adenosine deaminase-related metal-dependent hydrolase